MAAPVSRGAVRRQFLYEAGLWILPVGVRGSCAAVRKASRAGTAAIIVAMPQTLGRLGEEVLRKMPGAVIRAQCWLEHVLMADAF
jgi:hypothetical protein